ncbi:MAG TPA: thioredoxin family protein [Pedobacter sp.]
MQNNYTREEIMSLPEMKEQYDIEYPGYTPDATALGYLKSLIRGQKITIVLGTWCGDSRLQAPRFYKILDAAGVDTTEVTLICVNEMKQAEDGRTNDLNITRIPVFIFSKDGRETGRITEAPEDTLENDMVELLKNK